MVLLKRGFALSRLLLLSLLLGILCSIDVAYAAEGEQYPSNDGAASGASSQSFPEEGFGMIEDELEPMLGIADDSLDPMRGDEQSAFAKGWNQIDGSWYWCAEEGAAPSNGFVWIDSELYWFDPAARWSWACSKREGSDIFPTPPVECIAGLGSTTKETGTMHPLLEHWLKDGFPIRGNGIGSIRRRM